MLYFLNNFTLISTFLMMYMSSSYEVIAWLKKQEYNHPMASIPMCLPLILLNFVFWKANFKFGKSLLIPIILYISNSSSMS